MYYWKCISENQSQTQQKKIRLFFLKNDCRKKILNQIFLLLTFKPIPNF